jgi:hypothetical protein
MSFNTFSRSYLQAAPERTKQAYIENNIISKFIQDLGRAANEGKTRYMYTHNPGRGLAHLNTPQPTITNEDLIAAFQRKFPDCDISYEETWVEVDAFNKVLKKGIVIDWS